MNKENPVPIVYKNNIKFRNLILIIIAFSILFISFFIPSPSGLTPKGQIMIGILFMAGFLWITEPIPLAVTGLLIMILQPILQLREASLVFGSFGNQAIFFLIGAFIIASAMEKHGLHKRIALKFLSYFEDSPRLFTFGIMSSCAFLSFIMPEHGVAAFFLPIIVSVLIVMKVVPRKSNFGKVSMLAVAYGCSIGSLGTLVGGARNPFTVEILANYGFSISFFDWMLYSMPVVFICLPIVWLILQLSFPIEIKDISTAREEINDQVEKSGKMNKDEYIVSFILVFTIFLWIFFSQSQYNTYYNLAVIAIAGSILLFISGSITWKDIEKRVPWGIILLYGGAITLGLGIEESGAGGWIAINIFNLAGSHPYIIILIMIIFTVLLTNLMSNIAAVAILLPIGVSIATKIPGISPLLASMLIALSGGLAFMFVISTPGNAIIYSSGFFSSKDLFKAGFFANIICIAIIFIIAIIYWIGILGL
jgi:sodium-dependent dicarboxylate transporter 2/3/5